MFNQEELTKEYGLENYHISYLLKAHELVDFKDKKVLEVGGSMPRSLVLDKLNAAQWIGNEELQYYKESGGNLPHVEITEINKARYNNKSTYSVISGGIEDVNESFYGVFDVVFSMAAFEHINKLPEALDKIYKALKPGGKLITIFSPTWSSCVGHHLPNIYDSHGSIFNFGNSPIPPWSHLYMSRNEMYDHLFPKYGLEFAGKVIYYVFNSNHINRYFLEDYISLIESSQFSKNIITPIFPHPVPEDVLEKLNAKYGELDFTHQGLMILLEK